MNYEEEKRKLGEERTRDLRRKMRKEEDGKILEKAIFWAILKILIIMTIATIISSIIYMIIIVKIIDNMMLSKMF
jgi:hypothetical protein